jgi:16S rRNA (cytosine967-C5)-methyltransferase
MTPGARLQAAIELLNAIEASPPPADSLVAAYFRSRRYAGSKDRRAISDRLFAVLRHRARIDWWITKSGTEVTTRRRVIAALALIDKQTVAAIAALFDGAGYGATPLDPLEMAVAAGCAGRSLDDPAMPAAVRKEIPEWLIPSLSRAWGDQLDTEIAALNCEAPVDLRVNTLLTTQSEALATLAEDGIFAEPTPLSPIGLRLAGRVALSTAAAYRDGRVEVQDEASQIAALLVDARPGMTVCDLCAGGGGKTLALAATMELRSGGPGRLIAADITAKRLDGLRRRLKRSERQTIELKTLRPKDDPWIDANVDAFDRVLVDAPCSGSGAWRRDPDARWRLTSAVLADYAACQLAILGAAAKLVKPGGHLVYVTCSVLCEENDDLIGAFLASTRAFELVPAESIWGAVMDAPCPLFGPTLHLSPRTTGTDGFFVAVLARRA